MDERCPTCHRPFRDLDELEFIIERAANLLFGGHTSEAMKVLIEACEKHRLKP